MTTLKATKKINGKTYKLYPNGFTSKRVAEQVAKVLKKHPKIKGARIQPKVINKKRVYLIYIR